MLIEFLSDVIINMGGFSDDIGTIYIDLDRERLIATGNHPKRLLFYQISSNISQPDAIEAPLYIGSLAYLRAILASSLIKEDPKIELSYREGASGKKVCIESMQFLAKRFESKFTCTNPAILNEKDRVKQFPRPDDGIFFSITKEMRKEFDEVARFGTPKADMRLFTLVFDGTYVRAMFGGGTHTTTLVLTDAVTGNTDVKINKQVSLDRFRIMLKLASDNKNARLAFHPLAVWVTFDTEHGEHLIASPTIREQTK